VDAEADVPELARGGTRLEGLRLRGRAGPGGAAGSVDASARSVRSGDRELGPAEVRVAHARGGTRATLVARGAAPLRVAVAGALTPGGARVDRAEVRAGATRWALARPAQVRLRDGGADADLAIRGRAAGARASVAVRASVREDGGARTVALDPLRVEVRARGLAATLRGRGAVVRRGDEATAQLRLRSSGGGTLAADGAYARGDGRATFALRGFDPAPVAPLLPGIRRAGGRLDGDGEVTGLPSAPRLRGAVAWRDGSLETDGFGSYRPLRAALRADGGRASFEVDARSGGGRLLLRGEAGGGDALDATATLRDFPIVFGGELRARADGTIALGAALSDALVDAVATVRARVRLPRKGGNAVQPIPRPDGIVVESPGGGVAGRADERARPAPAAPPAPGRTWRLGVVTPAPVRFTGPELDVALVVEPGSRLEWRARRLLLFGALRVAAGHLSLAGAELDVVSRSTIRFSGPPEAAFVDVGPGRSMGAPAFGRRGPMRLFSRLSGGRAERVREEPRPLAHGSGEGAGWGSALTRWFAGQLPLGLLLERGVPPGSWEAQTALSGQLDVTSMARLAGDPTEGENRRAMRLGLRLSPRLRLEGTFGDGDAGALDLVIVRPR
jgi:hypothetical protein